MGSSGGNRAKPKSVGRTIGFSEIFEFLIANGHRESDLWEHSAEKLDLLYQLASERKAREQAVEDLRAMRNFQAAYVSTKSQDGQKFYESTKNSLIKATGFGEAEDVEQNRKNLAARLQKMGAKAR